VSYAVQWEPVVVEQVSRFMANHHAELEELLTFLDLLEVNPRPAGSVAWGPDYRRARIGAWRVLYRIDEVLSVIGIENVGRTD
jgi:mRNA interferase RelE/StbE